MTAEHYTTFINYLGFFFLLVEVPFIIVGSKLSNIGFLAGKSNANSTSKLHFLPYMVWCILGWFTLNPIPYAAIVTIAVVMTLLIDLFNKKKDFFITIDSVIGAALIGYILYTQIF